MNEDRHVQLLQLGIEGGEAFVIQIFAVDVAADLGAAQAKLAHRAFQFSCRHLRLLHRKIGKRDKTFGMLLDVLRKCVVDLPTQLETPSGVGGMKE